MEAPKKPNPANAPDKAVTEDSRIPMSIPEQKLAVPDLPGYHMYWFLGKNVARALRAGYVFVDEDEVKLNNRSVADELNESGNTDLGTRVSIIAGPSQAYNAQPERLFLMKIRQEWWEKDQKVLEARNEQIAQALRGGQDIGANPHGQDGQRTPEWAPQNSKGFNNLFYPKRR